jgi:hypothetical protein
MTVSYAAQNGPIWRAPFSRSHSKRPLMPVGGGSRMILIERCVDLKDETYRLVLADLTP